MRKSTSLAQEPYFPRYPRTHRVFEFVFAAAPAHEDDVDGAGRENDLAIGEKPALLRGAGFFTWRCLLGRSSPAIYVMSRRTSKVTGPDLFDFGASQAAPSDSAHAMPPPVLPSDLARCLAHLIDPDFERLLVAVNEEAKAEEWLRQGRGRPRPSESPE